MSRFNRHIILFFLILVVRVLAVCAEVPADALARTAAATAVDFREYRLRMPEERFIETFRQDPAFKYTRVAEVPGWWQRLERWIMRHLFRRYSVEAKIGWLDTVLKISAVLLLMFLIYKLIQGKYWKKLRFRKEETAGEVSLVAQQVNTVSYPALIGEALAKRDYILTLRIQYWYILYLMDEKGIVRNEVYKTNLSYYYEIREERLRQGFVRISRIFDCICYGEFKVDERLYQELYEEFNKFQEEVKK